MLGAVGVPSKLLLEKCGPGIAKESGTVEFSCAMADGFAAAKGLECQMDSAKASAEINNASLIIRHATYEAIAASRAADVTTILKESFKNGRLKLVWTMRLWEEIRRKIW